jgi:hypothetical protein
MFKIAVVAAAFAFAGSYRTTPVATVHTSSMFANWFKKDAPVVSSDGSLGALPQMNVSERKVAALYGMYVADAVAMPVHWMYNLANLKRDYGQITGFVKPKDKFEGTTYFKYLEVLQLEHVPFAD